MTTTPTRLTDEQIHTGLTLAIAATARPWVMESANSKRVEQLRCDFSSFPGALVLGWQVARIKGLLPQDREFLVHAANHYEAALRELADLRQEVAELRSREDRWQAAVGNSLEGTEDLARAEKG